MDVSRCGSGCSWAGGKLRDGRWVEVRKGGQVERYETGWMEGCGEVKEYDYALVGSCRGVETML